LVFTALSVKDQLLVIFHCFSDSVQLLDFEALQLTHSHLNGAVVQKINTDIGNIWRSRRTLTE